MKISATTTLVFALCSLLFLQSCDMDKDIDVPLPSYTKQPVVEGYVTNNSPFKILLTQTSNYFDSPIPELLQGAIVTITHNGQIDTLQELVGLSEQRDTATNQIYNYALKHPLMAPAGSQFSLQVKLTDGTIVTGNTIVPKVVPIEEIKFTGEGTEITLTASFNDPAEEKNYYRFLVHRNTPIGAIEDDDLGSDRLTNGKYNSFFTGSKFKQGDTLVVTLYSIEPAYYDFIRTLEDADDANGNPFAQPSKIKSTVTGGVGVFTSLSYDRKVVIVP